MAPSKGDPLRYLRETIQPGWIVVDVGANRGSITQMAAERVGPSGRVLAIEPDDRCHADLAQVSLRYPHVTVFETAVGGYGRATLSRQSDPAQSSIWPGAIDGPTEHVSVPIVTLDTLMDRADVVKIDAQGSESVILQGAARLLAACPRWVLEIWPRGLAASGATVEDVISLCAAHDLTPRWLDRPDEPATESVRAWAASVSKPKSYVNLLFAR